MEVFYSTGVITIPGGGTAEIQGRVPLLVSTRNPDIPLDQHQDARLAHEVSLWYCEMNLVERYETAYKICWETAYPAAIFNIPALHTWPFEKRCLIVKCWMWTFVVDDLFDNDTTKPGKLPFTRLELDNLLRALPDLWHGKITTDEVSGLGTLTKNIGKSYESWSRETALVIPNLYQKDEYFLEGINDWIDHVMYFGDSREPISSINTYYHQRVNDIGVVPCWELQMLLEDIEIPRSIRKHRYFKRVYTGVLLLISLTNDLLSWKKELQRSEPCTVVGMLINQGLSPQEAGEKLMKEIEELTLELIKHGKLILEDFPSHKGLQDYLRLAFDWQDGHWQYYTKMPRYGDGAHVEYRLIVENKYA